MSIRTNDELFREFSELPDHASVPAAVVAQILGIHRTTVYRLEARGAIPKPTRLGRGLVRWEVGRLREFLKEHKA